MTPEAMQLLKKNQKTGKVQVKEQVEVAAAEWEEAKADAAAGNCGSRGTYGSGEDSESIHVSNDQRRTGRWRVYFDDNSASQLADRIWLATGSALDVHKEKLLAQLMQDRPIPVVVPSMLCSVITCDLAFDGFLSTIRAVIFLAIIHRVVYLCCSLHCGGHTSAMCM